MRHPSDHDIATLAVHAGERRPGVEHAVVTPIFQSAMYEYATAGVLPRGVGYIRYQNTPNHAALGERLAALEGADAGAVAASGMGAVTAVLLGTLKAGDHLIADRALYGGAFSVITAELPRLGIEHTLVDAQRPETWREHLRPTTRLFYVESVTNPLLAVPDLEAVVAFAREHRLVSVVDNTFPTPINFRACAFGFDVAIHSATKYLNGHSDLVAGAIAGRRALVDRAGDMIARLGACLDPHACFLLERGIKTLALRMAAHNAGALAIARFLGGHRRVRRVHYPGLESHPSHERARRLLSGFGGMLAMELDGGADATDRFLERCRLFLHAPSLGGVESLIVRPATTSHASLSPADRQAAGVTDSLVRMSVGIESVKDLVADLEQALSP